jgi:hypothetical protein
MTEPLKKLSYKSFLGMSSIELSNFDYFYAVRQGLDVHEDFIASFVAIFNPVIIEVNDGLFVKENFTAKQYDDLLGGGVERSEIPYWLNMIELTDLLGEISYDSAAELGQVIRDCWAAKLEKTFPNSGFEARLLLEDDLDEVWVTICLR